MAKNYEDIVWSLQSEQDLDSILEYYLEISPDKAYHKILNIINSFEKIIFTGQWQVDEYDSSCRRAIVEKKFKVVYKVESKKIIVTRVYPTQKNLEII